MLQAAQRGGLLRRANERMLFSGSKSANVASMRTGI